MGGCQSRSKHRRKLLARLEQEDLQRGPCRQLPHPIWGSFRFQRMELLGRGAGGVTYLCRCLDTDETVAIKMIKRPIPLMLGHLMLREIMIQAELGAGHINIVGVKEVILTDTHLGIVMECANGGNLARYLMDKMRNQGSTPGLLLDETEASYLFRQLVSAVDFCHGNSIAHRDIKLDNTLLDHNCPPTLKLCDFGLSRCWGEDGPEMHTVAGTPCYMSPQLTAHRLSGYRHPGYDATKSDVWSMAVVLCVMLLGRFPYDGEGMKGSNHNDTLELVCSQQQAVKCWREIPIVARHTRFMSCELLNLLDRMFELDATKRISVSAISRHAWCTQPLPPGMQAAWNRMQRLQQARQIHFFPARATAYSSACHSPESSLHAIGMADLRAGCFSGAEQHRDAQGRCRSPAVVRPCCSSSALQPDLLLGSSYQQEEHAVQDGSSSSNIAQQNGSDGTAAAAATVAGAQEAAHTKQRCGNLEGMQPMCEGRAFSTSAAMQAAGRGTRVGHAGLCVTGFSKRCQCYDACNSTPEQCAEELQQLLTLASLPAPYQDPDAVLSRMQLVKVLYHIPLHKIPTISYFKDTNKAVRKGLGHAANSTSCKSIPSIIGTQIFPDTSPRTPCGGSSHAAGSSCRASIGHSPPAQNSPLSQLQSIHAQRTWYQTSLSTSSGLEHPSCSMEESSSCAEQTSSAMELTVSSAVLSEQPPPPVVGTASSNLCRSPDCTRISTLAKSAPVVMAPPSSSGSSTPAGNDDICASRDQVAWRVSQAALAPAHAGMSERLAASKSQQIVHAATMASTLICTTSTAAGPQVEGHNQHCIPSTHLVKAGPHSPGYRRVNGTSSADSEQQEMNETLCILGCGLSDIQRHSSRELPGTAVLHCTASC